jgi:hypothetical protein
VIASHYAEPVERVIVKATAIRSAPAANAEVLAKLEPGERMEMLDDSLGWAWGYAGEERRVGYVPSEALSR